VLSAQTITDKWNTIVPSSNSFNDLKMPDRQASGGAPSLVTADRANVAKLPELLRGAKT